MAIQGNLDSLRSEVEASDFDAVVAMSPGERSLYVRRSALDAALHPRQAGPGGLAQGGFSTLIVATQEEGYCREKGWIEDIRGYVQHVKSPIDVLAEVLQEKGLSAGRIGFEPSYLSVDFHKEMVASLPEAQFQACEKLLERVRMIKSDSEIEVLKRAAIATERRPDGYLRDHQAGRRGVRPGGPPGQRDLARRRGASRLSLS